MIGDAHPVLIVDALYGLEHVPPVGAASAVSADTLADQIIARLRAWAADFESGKAPATVRAVRADWTRYLEWCDGTGHSPLPASPDQVEAYLMNGVARGLKRSTLKRYANTIGLIHDAAGLPNPTKGARWSAKWGVIGKALGERTKPGEEPGSEVPDDGNERDQAAQLSRRDLDAILATLGDSPFDLRDAAMLCLAYVTLLREAELVAVQVEHLRYTSASGQWALWVPRSKTNRQGDRIDYRHVDAATMARIRTWQAVAGIAQGPLFRPIGSRARGRATGADRAPLALPPKALRPPEVARIFRARAMAAHLPHAGRISGHSTRIGMANDLILAGKTTAQIQDAGGWRSAEMVYLYTAESRAGLGAVADLMAQQASAPAEGSNND